MVQVPGHCWIASWCPARLCCLRASCRGCTRRLHGPRLPRPRRRAAALPQVLRDKWYLKGATLTNAIKRKPRVLGNVINCTEEGEGACAGLCTRCWAQF